MIQITQKLSQSTTETKFLSECFEDYIWSYCWAVWKRKKLSESIIAISEDEMLVSLHFWNNFVRRYSRSVGMVVGLALVVDLVGSLPDSRDRSLGNYSSFLGLARDFTIWATKIFTRSNFSQNWNILALQLLKESAWQMFFFFWNRYYFD